MKFQWTLWLIMLTPFIMLISIVTVGGGHGTPLPSMLCYPVLFLFDVIKSGGGPLLWTVLIVQFPVYGFIIDIGRLTSKRILVTGLLCLFHVVTILIAVSRTDL